MSRRQKHKVKSHIRGGIESNGRKIGQSTKKRRKELLGDGHTYTHKARKEHFFISVLMRPDKVDK